MVVALGHELSPLDLYGSGRELPAASLRRSFNAGLVAFHRHSHCQLSAKTPRARSQNGLTSTGMVCSKLLLDFDHTAPRTSANAVRVRNNAFVPAPRPPRHSPAIAIPSARLPAARLLASRIVWLMERPGVRNASAKAAVSTLFAWSPPSVVEPKSRSGSCPADPSRRDRRAARHCRAQCRGPSLRRAAPG